MEGWVIMSPSLATTNKPAIKRTSSGAAMNVQNWHATAARNELNAQPKQNNHFRALLTHQSPAMSGCGVPLIQHAA
jgi:hypothetical protein